MASSNKASIFVTLFMLSFILLPSFRNAAATWSSTILEEVCNLDATLTDWNKTFCIETLKSDNRIVSATNLDYLAIGIIESGLSYTTNTSANIEDMLKDGKVEPVYKKALNECIEFYVGAIDSFQNALYAVFKEDKDYEIASYDVLIAADSVNDCKKALVSQKVYAPSVSAGNEFVRYYAVVADNVVSRLWVNLIKKSNLETIRLRKGEINI